MRDRTMTMDTSEFDLDKYLRASRRVDLSSVEWERISELTGLPLFVCNRTGADTIMNFVKAESVVAHRGRRLLSMTSVESAVFVIEWDLRAERLRSQNPIRFDIPSGAL